MTKKAFEVGMDILKAQPCPVCGSIGAEIAIGCPVQAPAVVCPIRRKETARSRRTELSRIGGQSDEAPMSLEEMRAAFIHNKSDDKDWYEDASRDKELESTPKPKPKPKTSSLIDRARKANKENPRPGSADYKKE
tara:strand:- start:3548 stop:3952 length:405 start_codon:yes stop_codon:yes gene_type:complete